MTDVYQPYRDMLAGKPVPIHADRPYPGRYALQRNGNLLPVAIGPNKDGRLVALVDGAEADPEAIWISCAKRPVAQDAYKFRKDNGHWPDEPKPTRGSNMPSDPFDALRAEIDDKCAQADELLNKTPEIKSQEICNLFRNLQAQLLALNKRADGMHKEEKAPVLEQERQVDDKFRFRAAVKVLSDRLRSRFEAFMKAEERRLQAEADAKFRADRERAEAERKRVEAEQAKLMVDDPITALTSDPPEMPELPMGPEPVKVNAGGGFGRKAGLKSVWVPVLTDYSKALAHFAENAKIKELVQKLAEQAVKAGAREVPGFDVKEDRRAA
jgi:hypothetical protein